MELLLGKKLLYFLSYFTRWHYFWVLSLVTWHTGETFLQAKPHENLISKKVISNLKYLITGYTWLSIHTYTYLSFIALRLRALGLCCLPLLHVPGLLAGGGLGLGLLVDLLRLSLLRLSRLLFLSCGSLLGCWLLGRLLRFLKVNDTLNINFCRVSPISKKTFFGL